LLGEESVMMTGHQYVSGVGSSRDDSKVGVGNSGNGPEKKAKLTASDYVYRIATLVAVAFLLATVF
jgi:hypothetical protein